MPVLAALALAAPPAVGAGPATGAVASTGTGASGSATASGGSTAAKRSVALGRSHSVTLITGDTVRVRMVDGVPQVSTDPSQHLAGVVRRQGRNVYVVPSTAMSLVASRRVDPELFNITKLMAQGRSDARSTTLPVIVASERGALAQDPPRRPRAGAPAAPRASKARRKLPALGATAVTVSKARAEHFWADVTEADAGAGTAEGTAPTELADGLGKLWLDGRVRATLDRSVPQLGVPAAGKKGLTGKGVKVAVLDCGVDDQNADVAPAVIAERDFAGEGDTDDHCGHGTHVASIVAGSGRNSNGRYRGVAPGVSLLDGKVLDEDGWGEESWILAGMQWAVDQGADVINMSLGGDATDGTDPLSAAVDALSASSGALFVISAGNEGEDGENTIGSPGTAASALTVGAVDREGQVAEFSSRGPLPGGSARVKPEVTGPGVDIVAAQADGTEAGDVAASGYVTLSGTSMAAPHVAGAAAILAQAHPSWTGARLKAELVATARPSTDAPVWSQGTGLIDVAAAVDGTVEVSPASLDLGFLDWPHGDDPAVTRTVTYTNGGPSTADLTLAASLADAGGDAFPEQGVTVTPTSLSLAPGASGKVSVTVDPDAAGVGAWGGYLTASVPGTANGTASGAARVVTRTALGLVKETEKYDVEIRAIDRSGRPTSAFDAQLVNVETAEGFMSLPPVVDGVQRVRVPVGTWSVGTAVTEEDGVSMSQVVRPEVVVDHDLTLTLDARTAKPLAAAVTDVRVSGVIGVVDYSWTSADAATNSSFLVWSDPDAVFQTPTGKVSHPGFASSARAEFKDSEISASLHGDPRAKDSFALWSQWEDKALEGRHTVTLVPAPPAGRAVRPRGAYALLVADEDPETPEDDAVAELVSRGAAGVVLVHGADRGFASLEKRTVPALMTDAATGSRLAAALGHRSGRLTFDCAQWTRPSYTLGRVVQGKVPETVALRARRRDLVEVRSEIRAQNADAVGELSYPVLGPDNSGGGLIHRVKAGTVRTDYLPAGLRIQASWVMGADMNAGSVDLWSGDSAMEWTSTMPAHRAGAKVRQTWMNAVLAPSTAHSDAPDLIPSLSGDQVDGLVSSFTDGSGHRTEYSGDGSAAWTLTRNTSRGKVVADGTDPWVSATLPTGRGRYVLSFRASRALPLWRTSPSVRSVWSFTADVAASDEDDPSGEDAATPLPLLDVRTRLPLNVTNTARAGRPMTFAVTGVLAGADTTRVKTMTVEISADGGRHWRRATLTRVDADTFRAKVVNPKVTGSGAARGAVALRITAKAAQGSTVVQTVKAAYRVR
ncbi:MAG: S8 family serine peptidase [Actinomycetales bacterium]|nr:S8 family serine peptidase [Actinomycetales bacterium]